MVEVSGDEIERDPLMTGCNDKLFEMTKQTFLMATAIAKLAGPAIAGGSGRPYSGARSRVRGMQGGLL